MQIQATAIRIYLRKRKVLHSGTFLDETDIANYHFTKSQMLLLLFYLIRIFYMLLQSADV